MRSEEQTKRTTILHATHCRRHSDSGNNNATDSSDNSVPPDPLTLPLPQPCSHSIHPTCSPPCPTCSLAVQVTSQLGCQIIFPFLSPPLGVLPVPMLPPVCHSGSGLCPAFCNDLQRQRHQLHRQHHHQPSAIIIITRS